MADVSDPNTNELAGRLRRWLIAAGYLLGGWAILQSALLLVGWGLPFNLYFRSKVLTSIHRVASALCFVSPLLLVTGCWGLQHYRRWARPMLLTYSGMWVVGVIVTQVVQVIETLPAGYSHLTFVQQLSAASSGFDFSVYAIVFPILLILCLARPEFRDEFPEFGKGFAPIMSAESGGDG